MLTSPKFKSPFQASLLSSRATCRIWLVSLLGWSRCEKPNSWSSFPSLSSWPLSFSIDDTSIFPVCSDKKTWNHPQLLFFSFILNPIHQQIKYLSYNNRDESQNYNIEWQKAGYQENICSILVCCNKSTNKVPNDNLGQVWERLEARFRRWLNLL